MIVHPQRMPAGGVASQALLIERVDAQSPTGDGRSGAVTLGFPRWRMTVSLAEGDADEVEEWLAFIDSLRGAQHPFLAYDLTRPWPKAYLQGFAGLSRAGGGAFDGAATNWSVNATRDQVSLGGLPAGLKLARRDCIGWIWSTGGADRRALARCVTPAIASGGGALTVAIEPPLPTLVPESASVTLDRPACRMRQVTTQTDLGELDTLHSLGGRFVAFEELLP